MSKFIGKQSSVGIGKEVTPGTAVTPTFFIPVNEKDPALVTIYSDDTSDYGSIQKTAGGTRVYEKAEPTFGGFIFNDSIGLLCLTALGSVSTAANTPEAGVNTHTFSVDNDVDHPSLTIAFKTPNQDFAIPFCMMNVLTINYEAQGLVTYEAGFIGQKKESATNTAAYTEENKYSSTDFTFKIAATKAGLGAAASIPLKNLTLSIEKDVFEHDALGFDEPFELFNGSFDVNIEFELLATNTDIQDLFTGGTSNAMLIELENNNVTIGSSTNPKLTVTLDEVTFMEDELSLGNEDLAMHNFTAKAHFDVSAASGIEIELINTVTSY